MNREAALNPAETRERATALGEAEFDAFYRRTARPLWAFLLRMVGDPAAADDLAQKTFLQFLRTTLDSDEEPRLRGLVYRIATHLAVDHLRKVKREREGWLGLFGSDRSRERSELRHDFGRALLELKPRERALLWLAHVEGFDHREIASMLEVEEGSVRVLLFRARRKLELVLRKMGLGPEVVS